MKKSYFKTCDLIQLNLINIPDSELLPQKNIKLTPIRCLYLCLLIAEETKRFCSGTKYIVYPHLRKRLQDTPGTKPGNKEHQHSMVT